MCGINIIPIIEILQSNFKIKLVKQLTANDIEIELTLTYGF